MKSKHPKLIGFLPTSFFFFSIYHLKLFSFFVSIDNPYRIDKLYENNQFKITNRPHCWREMLFKIIEERVQQRVEAFQIEDRKLNQNWVTRYDDKFFLIQFLFDSANVIFSLRFSGYLLLLLDFSFIFSLKIFKNIFPSTFLHFILYAC